MTIEKHSPAAGNSTSQTWRSRISERFPPLTPEELAAAKMREAEEIAAAQERRRKEIVDSLFRVAGLPERHMALPQNTCREWAATEAKIVALIGTGFLLALIGPRGCGKTQLATSLIRMYAEAQKRARYIRTMDFFLAIRETFRHETQKSEMQVMQVYRECDLLVLDEIQERSGTEWESSLLTNLIDHRYGQKRDTLIIGNLPAQALKESLGPSIVSRMQETGGIITATWPSFRNSIRN